MNIRSRPVLLAAAVIMSGLMPGSASAQEPIQHPRDEAFYEQARRGLEILALLPLVYDQDLVKLDRVLCQFYGRPVLRDDCPLEWHTPSLLGQLTSVMQIEIDDLKISEAHEALCSLQTLVAEEDACVAVVTELIGQYEEIETRIDDAIAALERDDLEAETEMYTRLNQVVIEYLDARRALFEEM